MMRPAIKRAWVDRLRAQRALPRSEALRVRDRFTALGHLADLHRQVVGGEWVILRPDRVYGYMGREGEGLGEVLTWAGIRARDASNLETLIWDERMRPQDAARFVEVVL